MPNRSPEPRNSYLFHAQDVGIALEGWFRGDESDHDIAFWHSHPSGFLGPSEEDLQSRVEDIGNLVISLFTENGIQKYKLTWY